MKQEMIDYLESQPQSEERDQLLEKMKAYVVLPRDHMGDTIHLLCNYQDKAEEELRTSKTKLRHGLDQKWEKEYHEKRLVTHEDLIERLENKIKFLREEIDLLPFTFNIERIRKDIARVKAIKLDQDCYRLMGLWSKDDKKKALALFNQLLGTLDWYCTYFEAKGISTPKESAFKTVQNSGELVRVRPCADEYEGKTYLGLYLGDHATGFSFGKDNENIKFKWSSFNPCIYIFETKTVVHGMGSWWGLVDSENIKDITDETINNVPYVQILKQMDGGKDEE